MISLKQQRKFKNERTLTTLVDPGPTTAEAKQVTTAIDKVLAKEHTAFPKLLPRKHDFTSLVINSFHEKLMHAGVSHTLSATRREFWIPQGRSSVRRVLLKCLRCRRYQGGPYQMPATAPYPRSQIEESPPFTYTGLDYLGPLYVKVSKPSATQKVWLCLFPCLAVRAIHLEVVHDMTAEQFLFCLEDSLPHEENQDRISDNASRFKVVKSTVEEAWQLSMTSPDTQSYLAKEGINWSFTIELAPWRGGFYERLIGLVKQSLQKSIGKICLTIVQLDTVVKEVEAVINSRSTRIVSRKVTTVRLIPEQIYLLLDTILDLRKKEENISERVILESIESDISQPPLEDVDEGEAYTKKKTDAMKAVRKVLRHIVEQRLETKMKRVTVMDNAEEEDV
ncbi:uncharacterized protein LOC111328700 [Stylophora pistillata]|uniref:uncharacterized protein LOC111328700 n=1 Tax=Stylophora pistillata TaxID=50429 RepID=UPI000C0525B4|nr:uncharacterized protein LOC111328700 [Stylophora pistillata]